jgi:hypothetical protein
MDRYKVSISKFAFSLGVVLSLFSLAVSAAPLATGEGLPELNLPDQHGEEHTLTNVSILLFASDKAAGDLAHEVLSHTDKAEMAAKGVVFVSDISGMPTLVTRMFALPAMREYGYPVLLGYEKEDAAMFPRRDGEVTVLHIKAGKVSRMEYAKSPESLAGMIGIKIIPKGDS